MEYIDINPESLGTELETEHIKELVDTHKPEVLIVDNLTALLSESPQEADIAIKAMKFFKELQSAYQLTVIVVAHTPKLYFNQTLKVDHVGGSKHVTNFADSVVFIAKSAKDTKMRYIKHAKMRNTEDPGKVYDMVLKKEQEILTFEYAGMSSEVSHFEKSDDVLVKESRLQTMKELRAQGLTVEEIGDTLGVDKSTVSRNLGKLK